MKQHNQQTLDRVSEAVATGRKLEALLEQLKDVDTDTLCRSCGAEALHMDGESNVCDYCGHVQTEGEIICLSDRLWPQ